MKRRRRRCTLCQSLFKLPQLNPCKTSMGLKLLISHFRVEKTKTQGEEITRLGIKVIESEFKLRPSGSKSYPGLFEWIALYSIKLRHFGVSLSAFTYKLRKMDLARFFFFNSSANPQLVGTGTFR